ncbi:PspC domain-containing protein [Sphingomonas crocodyli]|uniref:PspC domain-containing protein n=1 Tax=Sphingomonas crocodyli TaxID=1979270 RepID=A0A437M5F0_9SPHN|nr:PspC domain-containing protein [Sphingomonas crocodyli]RVT92803.1 PspC domain-containing protein [Sphingomonas crocodyli]
MNASNRFRLNKTDGKIMGVCAGLADFTGVDATWIRIATVLLTLCGVGSTILLYLLVGLIAPAIRY